MSGVAQYPRAFSLVIGSSTGQAQEFADFRVQFHVRRGDKQTPNSADIRIFNLSYDTANRIEVEFTQLALQAGYPGNIGLIFRGIIKQVRKGRVDQKDSYVDITAADGDEAYNFSAMALSMAAGTTNYMGGSVLAMLQTMVRASASQAIFGGYGADGGQTLKYPPDANLRARVFYGMTRDEMREWADNAGCVWSIQDGALTIVPQNSYIPGPGEIPLISPATGLIGVPEQIQSGLQLRILLNPSIRIGQRVKLETNAINQYQYSLDSASIGQNALIQKQLSTSADGTYYVMSVDHEGDSRGTGWYSTLTCLAVDATVSPTLAPYALVFPDAASVGVQRTAAAP